jgi:hypothetical protein
MVTKMITCVPPSKSSKSGGYRTFQLDDPIYDGRYVANRPTETTAPPVQLYNPIFALLWTISPTTIWKCRPFSYELPLALDRSSAIYDNEEHRRQAISADLRDATSLGICPASSILTSPRPMEPQPPRHQVRPDTSLLLSASEKSKMK